MRLLTRSLILSPAPSARHSWELFDENEKFIQKRFVNLFGCASVK